MNKNKIPFKKLSKPEQRVAIAKDALKRLETGQYVAQKGHWLSFLSDLYDLPANASLQPLILQGINCKVCALGGLLGSRIALANAATKGELSFINSFSDDKVFPKLRTYFTMEQLKQMEIAFELGRGSYDYWHWTKKKQQPYEAAVIFGKRHQDNTKRLKAILKNLIKNKGEFIPVVKK